jgi:hypothetical protein
VSPGQRRGSQRPLISGYYTEFSIFHSSSSSFILERLSGPRSRPYLSENQVAAGIKPGTSGSEAMDSDHSPQRRSLILEAWNRNKLFKIR